MPVLFALFFVFANTIEFRGVPSCGCPTCRAPTRTTSSPS